MSTRGAMGFILEDKEYITYNHSDAYPGGLGCEILDFLNENNQNLLGMAERVQNLKLVNESDEPTVDEIKKCMIAGAANLEVATQSFGDWYCLLRETQGDLEKTLNIGFMIDNHEFLFDSLFCEWAYIINLDTNKLEVYKGFNQNPNGVGRYASRHRDRDGDYYGVELVTELDLFNLPKSMTDTYEDENEGGDGKYRMKLIYEDEWKNTEVIFNG